MSTSRRQQTIESRSIPRGFAFVWRRFELPDLPQPMLACVMVTVPANNCFAIPSSSMIQTLECRRSWKMLIGPRGWARTIRRRRTRRPCCARWKVSIGRLDLGRRGRANETRQRRGMSPKSRSPNLGCSKEMPFSERASASVQKSQTTLSRRSAARDLPKQVVDRTVTRDA